MLRQSCFAITLAILALTGTAGAETLAFDTARPPDSGAEARVDTSLPIDTSIPADDTTTPADDTASAADTTASPDAVTPVDTAPDANPPTEDASPVPPDPTDSAASKDVSSPPDTTRASDATATADTSTPSVDPAGDVGGRGGCSCVLSTSTLDRGALVAGLIALGAALGRRRRRR